MSSGHSWGDTEAGSIHVLPKTQSDFVFEMSLWKFFAEVLSEVVFSLTWGPDDTQSHAAGSSPPAEVCWDAEAILPIQPKCSET